MRITVLAGGMGDEREVSLRSGAGCYKALQRLGHDVTYLDFRSVSDLQQLVHSRPELVFLAFHGQLGEDGAAQGMLEWLGVPYTGSGVTASALCMDKYLSKLCFRAAGLSAAPCRLLGPKPVWAELTAEWQCAQFFVKPRRGGSSVGARIIHDEAEWRAFAPERPYLVEPRLQGREITIGFLRERGRWRCLPVLELRPHGEFYDYHCKYTKGETDFILPAPMPEALRARLEQAGAAALDACGVVGYGRVDMLLAGEQYYILEINNLPGMTETSDLPAQAEEAGMSYDQLVTAIVDAALAEKGPKP